MNIFHWLKESHPGITLLQETHSVSSDEIEWQKNWEGKIIFSHGTSFSSGVALLIPKQLTSYFEIKDIITDQYGRLILVECVIHNNPVILISVYFPTKDKPREQTEFLDYVKQLFYCVKYPYLILTSAYVLAGAYMDDQTRILFLKTNILVGTSMYAHDCACAYTGITPISLTFNLVVRECTS